MPLNPRHLFFPCAFHPHSNKATKRRPVALQQAEMHKTTLLLAMTISGLAVHPATSNLLPVIEYER